MTALDAPKVSCATEGMTTDVHKRVRKRGIIIIVPIKT